MTEVVVIGAGISGAATAYELATSGVRVTLIDRYGPAAMASGWTLAGVRQSGRHPAELPLAQAAVADWEHLSDKLGAPTYYTRRGNLRLARTEADLASLGAMVEAQSASGLELEMRRSDGGPLWVSLWMRPMRGEGGAIRGAHSCSPRPCSQSRGCSTTTAACGATRAAPTTASRSRSRAPGWAVRAPRLSSPS